MGVVPTTIHTHREGAGNIGGQTVADHQHVLRRETKRNKIQMQFSKTPLTGSVYVEGIGNLNEFDCGGTSGWMFSVNGEVPSVSAGEYVLKDGDIVRWYYSLSENAGGLE